MQMKISTLCLALGAALGMATVPAMAAPASTAWVTTATHAHASSFGGSSKLEARAGGASEIGEMVKW